MFCFAILFLGGIYEQASEWVTKHKRKGTEIRFINGHYYMYEVISKWGKL